MGDLKVVVVVVSRIQRLVQVVVRDRMQHGGADPAGVIPVDHLAHQPEIRLYLVGETAQRLHKAKVQHIRRVQTQPVDIKFRHPHPDGIAQIVLHFPVALIELHQQVVSAPVVVAKTVVILVISPEIDIAEPVPVGGILSVFLQIPKREEIPAHMIEHPVQDHADPLPVTLRHKVLKILIGAQPAVQLPIIGRLIAVPHRLEQGPDIERAAPQLPHVSDPGHDRFQPVYGLPVIILLRRACESQGIYMIKNCFVVPAQFFPPVINVILIIVSRYAVFLCYTFL